MPTQTPTSRIFRLAPSVASTFHATLSVGHNAEVPADCIADCQSALNRHVQTPLQQWVDLGSLPAPARDIFVVSPTAPTAGPTWLGALL